MALELPESLLDGLGDRLVQPTRESLKYEEIVREVIRLEESDLQTLELCGPSRSMSGLKHLRAYHHNIALRLAAGEKPVEICAVLSVTPQTITKLTKSSQFNELVEAYRGRLVEKTVDHFELMSLVGAESLSALHERLVGAERDEIPLELLRRISETFVDRIGHSPVRRSETLSRHSHELSRETIDRIKALHGEDTAYSAETVEATAVEIHAEESESAGAAKCISGAFGPLPKGKGNGVKGKGNGVPERGMPLLPAGDGPDKEEEPL